MDEARIAAAREKGRLDVKASAQDWALYFAEPRDAEPKSFEQRDLDFRDALDRLIRFERAEAVWWESHQVCDEDKLPCEARDKLLAAIEAIEQA